MGRSTVGVKVLLISIMVGLILRFVIDIAEDFYDTRARLASYMVKKETTDASDF